MGNYATSSKLERLAQDKWRRYLGDIAPEEAAVWDRDQLRHALELRFYGSDDLDAEDLDDLAEDLARCLDAITAAARGGR